MVKFFVARRDVLSSIFVGLCVGSYVGGVVFNILGAGDNFHNAVIGAGLMVLFGFISLFLKGVNNG